MELTFPAVAYIVLCFAIVAITALVLHQLLSIDEQYWHCIKTPSKPSQEPAGWGWARGGEGTSPGQLTKTPKDYSIPYYVTLCNKRWERRSGGRKVSLIVKTSVLPNDGYVY